MEHDDDLEACRLKGTLLDWIGDKWAVKVMDMLARGPLRFNDLMRRIGLVSHRMLTLTLRGLERDGLLKRTVYSTVPPKVEYELTDLGRSLIKPLNVLGQWAVEHRSAIEAARAIYDAAQKKNWPAINVETS